MRKMKKPATNKGKVTSNSTLVTDEEHSTIDDETTSFLIILNKKQMNVDIRMTEWPTYSQNKSIIYT